MENQDFKISINTVWYLVIANFLFTVAGAFAKILHWEFSRSLLTISIILFFATFIIVLSDILKNKVYNKTFWIMSMFILPSISPIIYMLRRNKLILHESKFGR